MNAQNIQAEHASPGTVRLDRDSLSFEGVLDGPGAPAHLTKVRTVIGRRNADVLLEDPDVSRQHAAIERYGSRYLIRDLGSTNGTFVNGERIDARILEPRDVIEVGGTRLAFRLQVL